MDIKDFKVGQTVYVEITGSAKRYKKEEELIEEWEVVKVGRKYVFARKNCFLEAVAFEKKDYGYYKESFVEKTDYSVDYILHTSKTELEESIEYRKLTDYILKEFRCFGVVTKLSLEQLRKIKAIISESE